MAQGLEKMLYRNSVFDRLNDEEPAVNFERLVNNRVDAASFRASVARDIQRLFNTRSNRPIASYQDGDLTVLDFGVPDFLHLSPLSLDDRAAVQQTLIIALKSFEPRLTDVSVRVAPMASRYAAASIQIEGWLDHDTAPLYVTFVTSWDRWTAQWCVHDQG